MPFGPAVRRRSKRAFPYGSGRSRTAVDIMVEPAEAAGSASEFYRDEASNDPPAERARVANAWGYAAITALRGRSKGAFDVPESNMYPVLHRLERAGLVVSQWKRATPRRRRVYELTRDGQLTRAAKQSEWRSFISSAQAVIGPVAVLAVG